VITPGLLRRAAQRGMQWRLLAIWWVAILLPSLVASLPILAFLSRNLERLPRSRDFLARLDGAMLTELTRQIFEHGSLQSITTGFSAALLILIFSAPAAAGATVAAARGDEPLRLQELLAGAGTFYGRMLRTSLCGLIPLGLAAALSGGAFAAANHFVKLSTRATAANRDLVVAALPSLAAFFVAHLLVDTARARFAADPQRRSAIIAMWDAARLLFRRPSRTLAIGAAGIFVALAFASLFSWLRLRFEVKAAPLVALTWVLGQLAQISVGWGRNLRIFGLAELARADAASKRRVESIPPRPLPSEGLSPDLPSAT
jgi:hypothetical protein